MLATQLGVRSPRAPEHQKHPDRAALRGSGTSLHPSVTPCWMGQSSPTFSPPPPSPHLHFQFLWQGELGALGFARPLWSLTLSDLPRQCPPLEMSTSGPGAVYMSCCCLMYTHPLYLLPNKRNTSVLPTETVGRLALRSPRA